MAGKKHIICLPHLEPHRTRVEPFPLSEAKRQKNATAQRETKFSTNATNVCSTAQKKSPTRIQIFNYFFASAQKQNEVPTYPVLSLPVLSTTTVQKDDNFSTKYVFSTTTTQKRLIWLGTIRVENADNSPNIFAFCTRTVKAEVELPTFNEFYTRITLIEDGSPTEYVYFTTGELTKIKQLCTRSVQKQDNSSTINAFSAKTAEKEVKPLLNSGAKEQKENKSAFSNTTAQKEAKPPTCNDFPIKTA
ncbi:hypothetical protein HHI36_018336 [Cryptolaemus montrouzieri]|uniref:Uncharacterized protein n=1 Tax=Cryptolaemus montrouzieri TaxID=559131 RepID=A0ABD2NZN3_9CUCU